MFDVSKIILSSNFAPNLTSNNPSVEYQNLQNPLKLSDHNYLVWSLLVWMFLEGKRKLSHLIGHVPSENPKFIVWDEEDTMFFMVMEFNATKDQRDMHVLDDS